MALEIRVTLLGTDSLPLTMPLSEFSHVPSQATIKRLNIPLPPLNPGASIITGPLLRGRGEAGNTISSGGLGGTGMTIGAEPRTLLGALLRLLALDDGGGAWDMEARLSSDRLL